MMVKNKYFWLYLLIISILTGVALAQPTAALAQDETTLSVLPVAAEVEIGEGNTVVVDLWVTQAVDLNAFDVTLTYDPTIVQLDDWDNGGFLSGFYLMFLVNEPGTLRIAATQFGQPAVSGEGVLLRLTFSGVAVGISDLAITEAIFADPIGIKSYPVRQDGSIEVYHPRFAVIGEVTLQSQEQTGGVPFTLGVGQTLGYGPYTAESLDNTGQNLQFDAVVEDTYRLTTHQAGYLNIHVNMNVFVTIDGETSLPALALKGGNAVWTDNVIDISDASVVGAWYHRSLDELDESAGFNPDVNFDGEVTILDLALVAGNFDLTSEKAYEDWQP